MSRDAHIPLVLWISAAALVHIAGSGGAVEVARTMEDREQIRRLVLAARDGLRPSDMTFEILTDGMEATPSPQPAEAPEDSPATETAEADPEAPPDPEKPAPKPEDAAPPPPEPVASAAPEAPKPAPEAKPEAAPAEEAKPTPPLEMPADRRLAIRQHVEKEQEDNPEAARIADDANKVEEESVARIRSRDQDDPEPTPGASDGPKEALEGDSDKDKLAESEDRQGDANKAPGEKARESESIEHHAPRPPAPPSERVAQGPPPSAPGSKAGGGQPPQASESPAPAAGGAGPASPEVVDAARGGFSLDPANPGGDGKSRVAGKKKTPKPYKAPVSVGSLGLGAPGLPGGPNVNLSMAGVEQAVGHDQFKKEREADGASRRSAHRGSWETNKFERWRAAIENYEPSVKLGNQTSLNAARVPFATYINAIHNRLHPIFAEEFLGSLGSLPQGHALNQKLVTHLEIVLARDTGRIVRLGVTRQSGSTAFDVVALNSVNRGSPYGKAPDMVVSPDGNVYLHWEFHRDPYDACTTRNARPYLLKEAPKLTPAPGPPGKAPGPNLSDDRATLPPPLLPTR